MLRARPTEVNGEGRATEVHREFEMRILEDADACDRGELGALHRREGPSSSPLVERHRARSAGELAGPSSLTLPTVPDDDDDDERSGSSS